MKIKIPFQEPHLQFFSSFTKLLIILDFLPFKHATLIPFIGPSAYHTLLPRESCGSSLSSLRSQLKCHLLREVFPVFLSKIASSFLLCPFLLFFLMALITIWNYIGHLFVYLFIICLPNGKVRWEPFPGTGQSRGTLDVLVEVDELRTTPCPGSSQG